MDNVKADNLSIEDIKNDLTFISDEVMDGYTLTRASSTNTETFYIADVNIK